MDLFSQIGKIALGSRLRLLTEKITQNAAQIYKLYDISFQPKWFPVFYSLSQGGNKTITAIAKEITHSHASVSKIIAEMVKKGLVVETKDRDDGRRNLVSLSQKGKEIDVKIQAQYEDVTNAIEEISAQTTYDLWKALQEWEFLLEQKSLFQRVKEQQKLRESRKVEIVDFEPKYAKAFKELNQEWISAYFAMEDADYKSLDNPQGNILDKGGQIFVALYDNIPVGVCALLKMEDPEYDYELAKMAVCPKVRGKNIGWLLGQAALKKAKELGAQRLYLESNTILKPAISLYHKLGFQKVIGRPSPYARCNIQMALHLK